MVVKKKSKTISKRKPVIANRFVKKRYRATARGIPVIPIKSDKVTLLELEKDVREARTLLYFILAISLGLFGLMLGITIKLFL